MTGRAAYFVTTMSSAPSRLMSASAIPRGFPGHRDIDLGPEHAVRAAEDQRDGVEVGVGDGDVGPAVAVQVAEREVEWAAADDDLRAGR